MSALAGLINSRLGGFYFMVRINVENMLWSDHRFQKLLIAVGDRHKSIGLAVDLWVLAQKYWIPNKLPIPHHEFEKSGLPLVLIECGLAESREDGIYAKGAEEHFAWWFKKQGAGKTGGNASAAKRRLSTAQALLSDAQRIQPSSSSSSSSSKEEENIYISAPAKTQEAAPKVRLTKEEQNSLFEAWGDTLEHFRISKDPRLDEAVIIRLARDRGVEATQLALFGYRFEAASKNYDPAKHVTARRLLDPKLFDKFVNLGAQEMTISRSSGSNPQTEGG